MRTASLAAGKPVVRRAMRRTTWTAVERRTLSAAFGDARISFAGAREAPAHRELPGRWSGKVVRSGRLSVTAPGWADFAQEDSTLASHPGSPPGDHLAGGPLAAAICNALVRIQRDYLGRGPTKARASIRDNTILVLMQDTLTKAERSLVADGRHEDVLRIRQSFQRTMRAEIVAAVQELTGRTVIAFMSDSHIDPDLACEIIVLEPDQAGVEETIDSE